jgi:pimeloyl-[acyl-carrier protein] methyl ester esterase
VTERDEPAEVRSGIARLDVASRWTAGTAASAANATAAAPLHVESFGAGPPLVLLHGFAMHGGVLGSLAATLAHDYRVHVVDLPGHGRSPAFAHFTLDAIADAVAAAMAERATCVAVLGWSFGGQVALRWARRHPLAVSRLMLACTTPSFVTRRGWDCAMSPATLRRFGEELHAAYRLTLQRFLTLQVQGSDRGRSTLAALRARLFDHGAPDPATLAASLDLLAATDLREDVAGVATPALVLSGATDTLVPMQAGQWLAHALPDAHHRVIEGAAHAPFLSHPDAFVSAVHAFLDAD